MQLLHKIDLRHWIYQLILIKHLNLNCFTGIIHVVFIFVFINNIWISIRVKERCRCFNRKLVFWLQYRLLEHSNRQADRKSIINFWYNFWFFLKNFCLFSQFFLSLSLIVLSDRRIVLVGLTLKKCCFKFFITFILASTSLLLEVLL